MPAERDDDKTIYRVVINHEEQYSIWRADEKNPLGWRDGGKEGTKSECLAYIKEVWVDMRPLSIRKRDEQLAQSQPMTVKSEKSKPKGKTAKAR